MYQSAALAVHPRMVGEIVKGMLKKLTLASIAIGVIGVSGSLLSIQAIAGSSTPMRLLPARNEHVSEPGTAMAAARNAITNISVSSIGHDAAATLSVLANFFRLEPAAGFLIGALLLVIATSLRLRVIRKMERDPELQS